VTTGGQDSEQLAQRLTMSPDKPHSLSKRLLWLLLAAIVLVACAEFYVSYRSALNEADEIFDYHMQQIAIALRPGLSVPPQGRSRERRKGEDNGDFLIQIWTADGLQLFEPDDSPALPQLAVFGFSNVKARGATYRVFSVQTPTQIVQIAQDLAVRRKIAGNLALRTAAPILLMAPILMLLVLWMVNRSFRPLARVRREVSERQISGLSPVNEAGLPEEIQPLVRELNHLLERVKEAFETQQHFVADAAHELRSPLTALKLQVQGLRRAAAHRRGAGRRQTAAGRGADGGGCTERWRPQVLRAEGGRLSLSKERDPVLAAADRGQPRGWAARRHRKCTAHWGHGEGVRAGRSHTPRRDGAPMPPA
jgi:two-component system OmpR family sensor kinase